MLDTDTKGEIEKELDGLVSRKSQLAVEYGLQSNKKKRIKTVD